MLGRELCGVVGGPRALTAAPFRCAFVFPRTTQADRDIFIGGQV